MILNHFECFQVKEKEANSRLYCLNDTQLGARQGTVLSDHVHTGCEDTECVIS